MVAPTPATQSGPNLAVILKQFEVEFVDTVTGQVVASFGQPLATVGVRHRPMAFDPARTRAVVIRSKFSDTLRVFDLTSTPIAQLASHGLPFELDDIEASRDGRWAVAQGEGGVVFVDMATGAMSSPFAVAVGAWGGERRLAISPDSSRVVVTAGVGNQPDEIVTFDISGAAPVVLNSINLTTEPQSIEMAGGGEFAVVRAVSAGSDAIAFVDPRSGALIGSFASASSGSWFLWSPIAITPDSTRAFVLGGAGSDSVQVFGIPGSGLTPVLIKSHSLPGQPAQVVCSPDGRLVAVRTTSEVVFYDNNGNALASFASSAPFFTAGPRFTRDSSKALVPLWTGHGGLQVIDTSSGTPATIGTLSFGTSSPGSSVQGLSVTPDDRFAIVRVDSITGMDEAVVIRLDNLSVAATIAMPAALSNEVHPVGATAITLDSSRAVLVDADFNTGQVTTLDLTTTPPSVVKRTLTLGEAPSYVALWNPPHRAGAILYGAGCSGTNGTPALSLSHDPFLGSTPLLSVTSSVAPATGTGALIFGSNRVSISVLGCTLLAQPTLSIPVAFQAWGYGILLKIPDDPSLSGAILDLQALVIDAAAPSGLAFSPGLEMTLGGT